MSNSAPSGDSLTHRLAKLRSAAEAIERLAAGYHSAIRPVREALQAVADVPLEERDRWAGAVSALARRLADNGMADVPASLEGVERWDRQFDAGKPGHAFAGRAFCAALAATIADGSPPAGLFAILDQHSFITTPAATREVCAVLSQLFHVHTERTAPEFTRGYGAILAEARIDGETLRHRLAQCGLSLSGEAVAAIHDWDECSSGVPFYRVDIRPAADITNATNVPSQGDVQPVGPSDQGPNCYKPIPLPVGANPYLTLKHILHELFWLAVSAHQDQDVIHHINPITDPWDGAEARARSCSAGWGIPFTTFDPILSEAKRAMRELSQVAAGNTSIPLTATDTRYASLAERLMELANSIPSAVLSDGVPSSSITESPGSDGNTPAESNRRGIPRAEAEILVRDWLAKHAKENPAGITRDAVAAGTGVSTGMVSKTAAWKAFRERRDAEAKPGAREVPLSEQLEAVIPVGTSGKLVSVERDALLNQLIRDQDADKAEQERRHDRRHRPS